jgi:hypothetical protein
VFRVADPDADAEMIAEWMKRPLLVEAWESPRRGGVGT